MKPSMLRDMSAFHLSEMLFRGRFAVAQTRSDHVGIWVDVPLVEAIQQHREEIYFAVMEDYERRYGWGIFKYGEFSYGRYAAFLQREGVRLPVTRKAKRPSSDDTVLERYGGIYPQLVPLRQCMRTLKALSRFSLSFDAEGRSHFFANNFGAITGRNAAPANEFLMLLPGWARFLIKPPPGWGVAYLDYTAEEVAIAAALSGDEQMLMDYYRDIYLQQAIRQGYAPEGATKATHGAVRDRFKPLVLGLGYGQTEWGLAARLNVAREQAVAMREGYFTSYPVFTRWRRGIINGARRRQARYFTPLGWPIWVSGLNDGERGRAHAARAMSNVPAQSAGADLMRVVMIAATEAGIDVCFSLHDGFMITAPLDRLDVDVARMVTVMEGAGEALLGVRVLVGDPEIVRYPDRYVPDDKKGSHDVWDLILRELKRLGSREEDTPQSPPPSATPPEIGTHSLYSRYTPIPHPHHPPSAPPTPLPPPRSPHPALTPSSDTPAEGTAWCC
jgi:DNA polymerase-1